MSDPSGAPESPSKKAPKKQTTPNTGCPTLSELIVKVVSKSKEPKGASLVAIKKALEAEGYDVKSNNKRFLAALGILTSKGSLTQVGGSYKVSKIAEAKVKKADEVGTKKLPNKSVKKATPKKPAPKSAAKKPAAKTSSTKKPAAKTSSTKKPAAKKTTKTASPAGAKKAVKPKASPVKRTDKAKM